MERVLHIIVINYKFFSVPSQLISACIGAYRVGGGHGRAVEGGRKAGTDSLCCDAGMLMLCISPSPCPRSPLLPPSPASSKQPLPRGSPTLLSPSMIPGPGTRWALVMSDQDAIL